MSLGERIARLRKQRDWKQDDLGERTGVHPTAREPPRVRQDEALWNDPVPACPDVRSQRVDELLAEDGETPTIRDPQLLRTFHQAQELDDQDRAMLVRLIQALLTRKRVEQALDLPA